MIIIKELVFCFLATGFFAIIMGSPKKAILFSSIIAAIGYVGCMMIVRDYSQMLGYFVGTVFIAFAGEVAARMMKMPSTIFIFPAVVPLVPGIGLYQTMLAFVMDEYNRALTVGVNTVFIAGVMAVSIALSSMLARLIMRSRSLAE